MVGGRLYIGGEVTRSRRAASVPAEDFRPAVDASVLHQARVISSHAVQDADAMRAASKQHDINFLNDISNKLASAAQPTHYYRETTPVYIGNRPPPANHYTLSDLRRRSSYAAPQGTDYEVNSYLSGGPQGYRGGRGGSVPPPRGPSVPRWRAPSPSRSFREGSASRGYSREKLAPYEDVVVGVAHTSLYGDIVIGIPYHKRHMFDLDSGDLGSSGYKAPPQISNGARHNIAGTYRNIGTVVTPPTSRRGSVSGPSYRRASISVPSNRKVLYDDVNEYLSSTPTHRSIGSHYGYSSDYPSGRPPVAPARVHGIQRNVDGPGYGGYSSYGASSSATAPVYSSSVTIPYLNGGATSSSTSSMPPKPPKSYSRPPVSEARRKVRDLLCKSKNDPHYFEGY